MKNHQVIIGYKLNINQITFQECLLIINGANQQFKIPKIFQNTVKFEEFVVQTGQR